MLRQVDERSRTPRSAARLSKSGRWASRGALRGQQNTRHTRRGAWCTQKRSGVALMVPRGTAGSVQQSTAAHTGGAELQSRAQRPHGAPPGRGARTVGGGVERACPGVARAHCGCSRIDGHAPWGDVRAVERRARHPGAVVLPAACRTLQCRVAMGYGQHFATRARYRNSRSHITHSAAPTHMQDSSHAMRHTAACDHTSFIAQHPHRYWIVCYRVCRRIGLFGDIDECYRRSTQ